MVYKSDALILRTYKLGEADRIVVFLTRDRGKKRGVAKGARRPRSRYVGALEPLTRGEVAYFEREQRELVQLNYVDVVRSPLLAQSGEALGHVGYFAELIDEWAQESHADERLFRLGASMVDAIAARRANRQAGALFRVLAAASPGCLSGVDLHRLFGDAAAGRGDAARGSTCSSAAGARRQWEGRNCRPMAMAFLAAAGSAAPEKLESLLLSAAASRELETAHRRLINLHLEKELKSARVLREMRHTR